MAYDLKAATPDGSFTTGAFLFGADSQSATDPSIYGVATVWTYLKSLNDITGLGTVTTGTWQATTITVGYGGTGLTSFTAGDTIYATGSTTLAKLSIGSANAILTSSGTAPQWSTAGTVTGLLSNFVGDSGSGGTKGLVPAPGAGDSTKYLKGDGTWSTVSGGGGGGTAGKHTIWIPASAMIARTTNGAAQGLTEMSTNKNMVATYDFDTSTVEYVQFEVGFPKSWNEGTVTFQASWSHASTTTNFGVAWGLAGVAQSDDDTLDVAFGTEVVVTDTGGTTNDRYNTAESSAITIAGTPAAGDVCVFQISRVTGNGSDTMAIDARLHGVWIYYTTDAETDA